PFDHRGIEVRVRDDDAVDTAGVAQGTHGVVVDEAQAFPKEVARVGAQVQRALRDGERGVDGDGEQVGVTVDAQLVALLQRFVRGPLLAFPRDVLAVVFADGAVFGRVFARGVLGCAGRADPRGHAVSSSIAGWR